MAEVTEYRATGRRKESVAQVRMAPGKGEVTVNGRSLQNYFHREHLEMMVKGPLLATDTTDKYDIRARVKGGGVAGQAGALRHGIARTLLQADESFKLALRSGGFLTRDPRMKERKKYGQKGARARFQFSKR